MRLSNTEWKVMTVAWKKHPITAREVLDEVKEDTGWAYTTTKTILSRLVKKNALVTEMRANTSIYEPTVTREEARRSEVSSLLNRAFDGGLGPLMSFLVTGEKFSEKDREELRRLLDDIEDAGDDDS
jgi:BlaI family transcriptional regulator, penicillinase repressor